MQFKSFFDEFPHLLQTELATGSIYQNDYLKYIPAGNYAFVEMFCAEPACDCRRVLIRVISINPNKAWTVLNYGWDSDEYYKSWFASDSLAYGLGSGVSLGKIMQEPLEQEFLDIFKRVIQHDKAYTARIEQHYYQFKEKMQHNVKHMLGNKPPDSFQYH